MGLFGFGVYDRRRLDRRGIDGIRGVDEGEETRGEIAGNGGGEGGGEPHGKPRGTVAGENQPMSMWRKCSLRARCMMSSHRRVTLLCEPMNWRWGMLMTEPMGLRAILRQNSASGVSVVEEERRFFFPCAS